MASFNTEKFNFFVKKSWGIIGQADFFNEFDTNANLTKLSAKPVTKEEGGDLRIPFEFRNTRGEVEIAGKKRFDESLGEYKNGVALAVNSVMPKFIFNFRNIGQGYESDIRTTDMGIKAIFYKTQYT